MVRTNKFKLVAGVVVWTAFFAVPHQARAFEWQNLWSTPAQRASKQLESQQYDELIEQAPNTNWRGVGEYRKGDYAAAIESFSQQREAAALAGSTKETEQAMYNQANALTLNESYAEAISLFDEVLELNPDHSDANHNRAIAEQLLEKQEQQQKPQGSGDESQESEQSTGENGEQSPSDQQEGEQEQSDQPHSDKNENAQSSDENAEQADNSASPQDQAEQDAQAAQAMQAEQSEKAEKAEDANNENAEREAAGQSAQAETTPDPLTEKEQANEQWLRQIPDDPAGLLQRKLQNRHLTDFPKVKDSVNPW